MIDRFTIERQISTRTSADAYLAIDTKTGLKLRLRRIHSQLTVSELKSLNEAFLVTQRQLALVKSDLITHITESGIDQQGAWLALPFYDSEHLLNVYKTPIALPEFQNLATQLLLGFKAIHDQNLVHGAFSMDSVDVIAPDLPGGRINYRIRDLGMRKLMVLVQNPHAISSLPGDVALLAPELFNSQDAEPSSDLYMLGQLLYTLLLHGHPFAELDDTAAFENHAAHNLPLAHKINPDIPEEVSLWVDKLTQPNPADRYHSADDALSALPSIAAGIQRQPTSLVYNKEKLTSNSAAEPNKRTPYIYLLSSVALITLISLYFIFRSNDRSETTEQFPHTAKQVASIEIKALSTGTISGADHVATNSTFRVGSSPRSAKPWGTGKTAGAKGPDLGASYRAFIVFKVADIIDADTDDEFINVSSLKALKMEMSFKIKNDISFLPLLYTPEILETRNYTSIKKASLILKNGITPSIENKTCNYTLENIDLSDAQYSGHFVFMVTASKKPLDGEIQNLARTTISLNISK